MARTPENLAFAERLRQALTRGRRRVQKPSELAQQFNLRYRGTPISNQAAQKWLAGENKPTLDKIETLAQMFDVSVQWLRYGVGEMVVRGRAADLAPVRAQDVAVNELKLLARYRTLSAHQQFLVTELIGQLAMDRQNLTAG